MNLLPFGPPRQAVKPLDLTLAAANTPPPPPAENKIIVIPVGFGAGSKKPTTRDRIAMGLASLGRMQGFIGRLQSKCVAEYIRTSEERDFFIDRMTELANHIATMPATYGQKDVEDPIVHLHYFIGGCDWWITEKDTGHPDDGPAAFQSQAFGFACLGDPSCAELGYISLPEILSNGAELDFHWTPKPLSEVRAKL